MAEEEMKLYKVSEVAERFKVHHRTVLNWIREGELAAYKVGNTDAVLRISEAQIQEYLANHKSAPTDDEEVDDPRDNVEE